MLFRSNVNTSASLNKFGALCICELLGLFLSWNLRTPFSCYFVSAWPDAEIKGAQILT